MFLINPYLHTHSCYHFLYLRTHTTTTTHQWNGRRDRRVLGNDDLVEEAPQSSPEEGADTGEHHGQKRVHRPQVVVVGQLQRGWVRLVTLIHSFIHSFAYYGLHTLHTRLFLHVSHAWCDAPLYLSRWYNVFTFCICAGAAANDRLGRWWYDAHSSSITWNIQQGHWSRTGEHTKRVRW